MSELPNAVSNFSLYTDGNEAMKTHLKSLEKEALLTMVFDWDFLMAWVGCSTWAEISDELENHESTNVGDDIKEQIVLMRSAFLLVITTLYNNPLTLGKILYYNNHKITNKKWASQQ